MPDAPATPHDRRPMLALLAANGVSQIGNMTLLVAGPWFVLQTTGSAAKTGLISGALAIGAVVPALLGGPFVDRVGFKRTSVLMDVASSSSIALVPILHGAGVLTFWQLVLLVFLLSSFNAQGDTARYALVPALAQRAGMSMERANSYDRAIVRIGQLAGPPLAGVLIAFVGSANVLYADAVTFTLSALLVAFGVPRSGDAPARAQEEKPDYRREMREGLRFLRTQRLFVVTITLLGIGNFMDVPLISVILPVYVKEFYGSATNLGVVVGAMGAGALLGTLVYGWRTHRLPRHALFVTSIVCAPLLAYGTLVTTPSLGVLVAAFLVAGFVAGPINPMLETVVQERTPPEMLGRVMGSLSGLSQAGIPFGSVLAGFVIGRVGVVDTLVGMTVIAVCLSVVAIVNPSLRDLDAPAAAALRVATPRHPRAERLKRWAHHRA
jgi:MFS family permease